MPREEKEREVCAIMVVQNLNPSCRRRHIDIDLQSFRFLEVLHKTRLMPHSLPCLY